jgi:hypothetical protein
MDQLLISISVHLSIYGSTALCWALAAFQFPHLLHDHLSGLVVRVPGYRSRGPGFDPRHYQIF